MTSDNKTDFATARKAGDKPRKFRKIETDFFQFEFEDGKRSLEGYLISKNTQTMRQNNEIGKYEIQSESSNSGEPGKVVTFLGSVDLDDKLRKVEIGQYVRITLTGQDRTGGGNQMRRFDVEVEE